MNQFITYYLLLYNNFLSEDKLISKNYDILKKDNSDFPWNFRPFLIFLVLMIIPGIRESYEEIDDKSFSEKEFQ